MHRGIAKTLIADGRAGAHAASHQELLGCSAVLPLFGRELQAYLILCHAGVVGREADPRGLVDRKQCCQANVPPTSILQKGPPDRAQILDLGDPSRTFPFAMNCFSSR